MNLAVVGIVVDVVDVVEVEVKVEVAVVVEEYVVVVEEHLRSSIMVWEVNSLGSTLAEELSSMSFSSIALRVCCSLGWRLRIRVEVKIEAEVEVKVPEHRAPGGQHHLVTPGEEEGEDKDEDEKEGGDKKEVERMEEVDLMFRSSQTISKSVNSCCSKLENRSMPTWGKMQV